MNIEEERKAFEATVLPGGVFAAVTWDGKRYSMPGVSCMTQDLFAVWCKAKAHAEEMAKPLVKVRPRLFQKSEFAVYVGNTYHQRLFKSMSPEECVAWAVAQGYRVEVIE